MRYLLAFLIAVLSLAPAAPAQADPASWPARDSHEGLLVTADPYTDGARSKAKFGKKIPLDSGILALEVFFRNDNDKPLLVELDAIRLLLEPPQGPKQQLAPLAIEEVIEQMISKTEYDVSVPRKPLPGSKPRSNRTKEYLKLEETIRPLLLEMSLIPPKASVRGFLFFHLGRRMDAARYARLYLPDVRYMHNKQPLFFFEVDLSKAAQ